jgi:hypothetical protein
MIFYWLISFTQFPAITMSKAPFGELNENKFGFWFWYEILLLDTSKSYWKRTSSLTFSKPSHIFTVIHCSFDAFSTFVSISCLQPVIYQLQFRYHEFCNGRVSFRRDVGTLPFTRTFKTLFSNLLEQFCVRPFWLYTGAKILIVFR